VGKFGRGGIGGSFILGIELFRLPKSGFGGGNKLGVIPPLAKGISGGIVGAFENLSFKGGGGLCRRRDGILLMLFGLFSAKSLSANPPCF
jgi:hypothetical protein